ncbi:hypothetical protein C5748_18225 [Phyllobacterium phragmitis]|uniref:Uncharacterized protein n=1 Tax=Phyllobacterium phragmitis TaxID=2670329 RepID=A0A2S9INM7_9HYPH|nr:hypothetical protein [Phyllobacterium phragmitis]PRD42092.1 hypothetical protein C5748_18225 [Phyllobacterium phragmitis]
MKEVQTVVVAWYRPEQYAAVRAFAADADRMEKTFQEWKIFADEAVNAAKSTGKAVIKVDFDHTAFMRWASTHNVHSTQQTRIQFCIEIATRN